MWIVSGPTRRRQKKGVVANLEFSLLWWMSLALGLNQAIQGPDDELAVGCEGAELISTASAGCLVFVNGLIVEANSSAWSGINQLSSKPCTVQPALLRNGRATRQRGCSICSSDAVGAEGAWRTALRVSGLMRTRPLASVLSDPPPDPLHRPVPCWPLHVFALCGRSKLCTTTRYS